MVRVLHSQSAIGIHVWQHTCVSIVYLSDDLRVRVRVRVRVSIVYLSDDLWVRVRVRVRVRVSIVYLSDDHWFSPLLPSMMSHH
jgi:hypothetical protein